jgi:IS1 family transposase
MSCIHTLKKAKQIRVWTAIDRNRLRFVEFEVGDARSETLRKFWNKITLKRTMWRRLVQMGIHHSKKTLILNTSLRKLKHALQSHLILSRDIVLPDYNEKTKCYSKSEKTLTLSVKLLVYEKFNLY